MSTKNGPVIDRDIEHGTDEQGDGDEDPRPEQGIAVVGAPESDEGSGERSELGRAVRHAVRPSRVQVVLRRAVATLRRARLASLLLVLLSVASTIAAVAFGVAWSGLNSQKNQQASAERVARDFLLALTNFDGQTVDADFTRISTYATGDFAKQEKSFFGSNIRQALEQAQAQSRGQVRDIFTESMSGGEVNIFAVVDQTYANSHLAAPATDTLRLDLTLVETSAGWRISEVTVLQAPTSSGSGGSGSGTSSSVPVSPTPPSTK